MPERHECPRPGCKTTVDNRLFCCAPDWFALSALTRRRISRTAALSPVAPARREAFAYAQQEWAV